MPVSPEMVSIKTPESVTSGNNEILFRAYGVVNILDSRFCTTQFQGTYRRCDKPLCNTHERIFTSFSA